jgi:hypothetical protein
MTYLATIIDTHTLAKVIMYSLIAGVGISATFAIAISAVAGINDASQPRGAASVAHAAIAAIATAASIAAVVFAIILMTQKS